MKFLLFSHVVISLSCFCSSHSDEEDTEFGECTILIEDEAVTASQQVGKDFCVVHLTSGDRQSQRSSNSHISRKICHALADPRSKGRRVFKPCPQINTFSSSI